MTVVPFPADHLADRIRACVDTYLFGDEKLTVNLTVDLTEVIEAEMRAAGFPADEIDRQVEAFMVRAHAAMVSASLTGGR